MGQKEKREAGTVDMLMLVAIPSKWAKATANPVIAVVA